MKVYSRAVSCAVFMFVALGTAELWAQESAMTPSVLHIQQTQTQSAVGTTYLAMYHVLNGATSPAEALGLTGTISLKNDNPIFSQVLWILVYWQGNCPAHDINLKSARYLWSDISKNVFQSDSTFRVNLDFPYPLPMTGCIGLYYGGGSLNQGDVVTMTADLNLTYRPVTNPNPNTVWDLSGEYCFGQDFACENATAIDGEGFAMPFTMPAGHLVELIGNISDSTFDGTSNGGPIPTGKSWGSGNDFYLLPGGCGIFEQNLNSQGFPNPAPLSTLHNWLPHDALHLASVPLVDRIPPGETGKATLYGNVETILSVPVTVNAGDCMLVIYSRSGNGATDNETQVHAVMAP